MILTDEELVIYEIAFHLKMPIYKLAEEMSYEELLGWMAYFESRPVGWRDDDRTYKLLQVQGVKEKAINIFPSLSAIYNPPSKKRKDSNKIDIDNLKKSTLFSKMLKAKDGENINIW